MSGRTPEDRLRDLPGLDLADETWEALDKAAKGPASESADKATDDAPGEELSTPFDRS